MTTGNENVETSNESAPKEPRTIYVAAASSEIERAKAVMSSLRAIGFEVVSDWPEMIEAAKREHGDNAANPTNATDEQRLEWAMHDLHQVARARALWILLPIDKPTIGAWVELGATVAFSIVEQTFAPNEANRYTISSGPNPKRTIFTAFTDHYETDEAAFEFLAKAIKDAG